MDSVDVDVLDDTEGEMTEESLKDFFPDRPDAVELLMDIWHIIQAWDDAYDDDPADHHSGYTTALIKLPSNPLYLSCSVPFLLSQCYYDWMTANRFEECLEELHKAYMLRAGYFRIVISVIHMIYGPQKAEQEAPILWRMYIEDFDEYLQEMHDNASDRTK